MRPSLLVLALLLVAAPNAAAGTEERPELQDAANDTAGGPFASAGADLLAAWIHDETQEGARLTLKIGELDPEDIVVADVYWALEGPEAPPTARYGGVRLRHAPTGPTFHLLAGDYPGTHVEQFREERTLAATLRHGAPAYVTWTLPWDATHVRTGATFTGWSSLTYLSLDHRPLEYRDVAASTRPYQTAHGRLLEGAAAPNRPPDRLDPDDARAKFIDLQALWTANEADPPAIVLRLAQIGHARPECHARIDVHAKDAWTTAIRIQHGPNRTHGVERLHHLLPHASDPPQVRLQPGRPGYVLLGLAEGTSPPDPNALTITAKTLDPCPAHENDLLEPPAATPAPGIETLLALAVILARRKL